MKKQVINYVLCVIMAVGFVPLTVSADESQQLMVMQIAQNTLEHRDNDELSFICGARFKATFPANMVQWLSKISGGSNSVNVTLSDVEVKFVEGNVRQSFLLDVTGIGGNVRMYSSACLNEYAQNGTELLWTKMSFQIGSKNKLFNIPESTPDMEAVDLTINFNGGQITGATMSLASQTHKEQERAESNPITTNDIEFIGDLASRINHLYHGDGKSEYFTSLETDYVAPVVDGIKIRVGDVQAKSIELAINITHEKARSIFVQVVNPLNICVYRMSHPSNITSLMIINKPESYQSTDISPEVLMQPNVEYRVEVTVLDENNSAIYRTRQYIRTVQN